MKEEEKEIQKKKKPKALILLVILVILFGGASLGAYFLYGERILKKGEKAEVPKVQKKEGKPGAILTLDPFLLNLSGSLQRYAKISISLELKDQKTLDEAKKIVPALRDRIISTLSSKTAETLLDVAQRESIKSEIGEKIKGLFEDEGSVKAVYITDIVIQ